MPEGEFEVEQKKKQSLAEKNTLGFGNSDKKKVRSGAQGNQKVKDRQNAKGGNKCETQMPNQTDSLNMLTFREQGEADIQRKNSSSSVKGWKQTVAFP